MTEINLTLATAPQFAVLLDLNADEAERVARAGPFADLQALRAALPARRRNAALPERAEKLDLNVATREMLVDGLGLPADVAAKVLEARPFYSVFDLARVPELPREALPILASAFRGPRLTWRDKTRGSEVAVSPNPAKLVVVAQSEAESAGLDLRLYSTGVRPLTAASGTVYSLFKVLQVENAGTVVRRIRTEPAVNRVIPAMRDAAGEDVFLDPAYIVVQFAANLSPIVQDRLLRKAGLELERRHRAAGLVTAKVPGGTEDPGRSFAAIDRLGDLNEVVFAEPAFIGFDDLEDGPSANDDGNAERGGAGRAAAELAWNLAAIRAAGAWAMTRGHPDVVIAVIDSGIDTEHAAFADCLLPRGSEDWNFESLDDQHPTDLLGHGSFVAALAAGRDPTHGELGLAPDCKVLPLKVPLSGSVAAYADRRAAILYALDQVSAGQRLVINLSWKTTGDPPSIRTAIEAAAARGAVIVASAGNWPQYEDQPHYPSDYPGVISVGATRQDGGRALYSYFGRGVDIAAPGGNGTGDPSGDIVSVASGGGYRNDFGTSFAAPQVAAAAALLLSRDRTLSVAEVRRLLSDSASPRPGAGIGAGLLDVGAALAAHEVRPGSPGPEPSPTPEPQPSPDPSPGSAPSPGSGLEAVNTLRVVELTARYGMFHLTARLIETRRPIASLEEIRTVLGMTPEIFAHIAGGEAREPTPPDDEDRGPQTHSPGILPNDSSNHPPNDLGPTEPTDEPIDANTAPLVRLLQIDGLLPFTARLVVARRPHRSRDDLMSLLGITPRAVERLFV